MQYKRHPLLAGSSTDAVLSIGTLSNGPKQRDRPTTNTTFLLLFAGRRRAPMPRLHRDNTPPPPPPPPLPPPPRNPHANFPLCLLLLHPLSTFPLPCSLSPPPLLSFASTFLDIRSGRRRSAYSFYSAVHIPLPRPGRSLSPHSRRPPLLLPLPTLRAHSSFCLIACRGLFYRGAH